MGFVRDAATALVSPAAGLLSKNKKKAAPGEIQMRPSMISTTPNQRPISMIGSNRNGY